MHSEHLMFARLGCGAHTPGSASPSPTPPLAVPDACECVQAASAIGSTDGPRAWSKYSVGSSAYERRKPSGEAETAKKAGAKTQGARPLLPTDGGTRVWAVWSTTTGSICTARVVVALQKWFASARRLVAHQHMCACSGISGRSGRPGALRTRL